MLIGPTGMTCRLAMESEQGKEGNRGIFISSRGKHGCGWQLRSRGSSGCEGCVVMLYMSSKTGVPTVGPPTSKRLSVYGQW